MLFSSPIYSDYNGIFLIFIGVTLQNLWAPVRNRSGIFHFEKSAVFRTLQLLRTAPLKSCNAGRSGDLLSGLTRDYTPRSFLARKQLFLTRKIKRSSQRNAAVYKFRLHLRILYPETEAAASLLEKLYAVGASYCGTR